MEIRESRTLDQILQEALRRENEAHDFYADLAIHCNIDFVKELLEKLKNEESRHARWVQDMITRLNSGKDAV
ncbi:MAG: ferritin family protein [Verrucomicrobiia bacterium]